MSTVKSKIEGKDQAHTAPFQPTADIIETDVQRAIEQVQANLAAADTALKAPEYLVGALSATLTAERLVTNTSTVEWDLATAGQAKASIVALSVNTGQLTNDGVTDAKLRNSAGLSVIGRSANSTGDPADIVGTDGQVLRVAGTTLGFGTVATAGIADDAVTFAKMQEITTDRLIGRDTASTGNPEEISVGGGLEFTGSAGIQRAALTGDVTATAGSNATTIANDAVTNAKLADMAEATFKMRAAGAGTGDPIDGTAAQAKTVLAVAQADVSGLTTADSPQFTAINLGHPTDTTFTRVSAGVAAIEGSNILLASGLGSITQAFDADTLKADVSDDLTVGFTATAFAAGTKTTGTFTPDPASGNFQTVTNGGAHTLDPPSSTCTMVLQYTNNGSAGTITTSGYTKVTGSSITTTNGDDFMMFITKVGSFSYLHVQALQ